MIYVSSSSVKVKTIKEAVTILVENGFKNIELSGGTTSYDNLESDLLELKERYNLNYLCHNYFPPPSKDFVLNLASLDEETATLSYDHIKQSLQLSSKLGATKFAFHAGFLIDIKLSEIGKSITKKALFDREKAKKQFCDHYNKIQQIAHSLNIEIYIENNVLSLTNFKNYEETNPFFITDSDGYSEFNNVIKFTPLLDVAHLKVSCTTLNKDFEKELAFFSAKTDYIHISDNNGKVDSNKELIKDSAMYKFLKSIHLHDKTITLEVYEDLNKIKESQENLEMLL